MHANGFAPDELASLTVEDFGLDRLKRATLAEVEGRLAKYKAMLTIE